MTGVFVFPFIYLFLFYFRTTSFIPGSRFKKNIYKYKSISLQFPKWCSSPPVCYNIRNTALVKYIVWQWSLVVHLSNFYYHPSIYHQLILVMRHQLCVRHSDKYLSDSLSSGLSRTVYHSTVKLSLELNQNTDISILFEIYL